MTTGIYAIYFANIDKIYIGQSQNIEQRFISHKSLLKYGHTNYKIHNAYKIDPNPEFIILLQCKLIELETNEVWLISEFDSIHYGLNIASGGEGGSRGVFSGKCKNTEKELESAFLLLAEGTLTLNKISDISNVSKNVLSTICAKTRHIWLHEKFPELSEKVHNNKSLRLTRAQESRFNTSIVFISPEGIEYECSNRNQFAKQHGLNSGHLGAVARGAETQHKGWTLKKEVSE